MTPHPKRSPATGCSGASMSPAVSPNREPESWSGGTKPSCRRHREVELQRIRQQEHAVDGRAVLEVGEVHGVEVVDERARPVVEHSSDRNVVGDAEREIQIGEAIAAVDGKRAHGGSGNDALILLREA